MKQSLFKPKSEFMDPRHRDTGLGKDAMSPARRSRAGPSDGFAEKTAPTETPSDDGVGGMCVQFAPLLGWRPHGEYAAHIGGDSVLFFSSIVHACIANSVKI